MTSLFDLIETRVRKILNDGPTRVMVRSDGKATSPSVAKKQHNVTPDVIFVRDDNWSLGAPNELKQVAYETWKNQWVLQIDVSTGEWTLMN